MNSKIKLKKFLNLKEAENFMNNFGNKKILRRELIPLHTPYLSTSKTVYFVFLEYLLK